MDEIEDKQVLEIKQKLFIKDLLFYMKMLVLAVVIQAFYFVVLILIDKSMTVELLAGSGLMLVLECLLVLMILDKWHFYKKNKKMLDGYAEKK